MVKDFRQIWRSYGATKKYNMAGSIDKLIINSPHQEPQQHWFYDRENRNFYIKEGRRPAGYVMATPNSKAFDDPGIFV
jgi:type III restriction enzyme